MHVKALTATATKQTRNTIFATLGMTNTYTMFQSPERENFSYSLISSGTFQIILSAYMEQLQVERQSFLNMLICCQNMSDCANI